MRIVKKSMEQVCSELGLSMSAAFTIFAKKVGREKRIPFEVSVDSFYSEKNMQRLERIAESIMNGSARLEEHEIIEVDWCGYYEKKAHGKITATGRFRTKRL